MKLSSLLWSLVWSAQVGFWISQRTWWMAGLVFCYLLIELTTALLKRAE